jgi:hypothetical protein
MREDTVVVNDVLIVRRMEQGWLCEIAGRPAFLDKVQVAPGTRLPSEGRRGPVVVMLTAAAGLGVPRRRTA